MSTKKQDPVRATDWDPYYDRNELKHLVGRLADIAEVTGVGYTNVLATYTAIIDFHRGNSDSLSDVSRGLEAIRKELL